MHFSCRVSVFMGEYHMDFGLGFTHLKSTGRGLCVSVNCFLSCRQNMFMWRKQKWQSYVKVNKCMTEISFPQGLEYFHCCYSHLDKKDGLGITTVSFSFYQGTEALNYLHNLKAKLSLKAAINLKIRPTVVSWLLMLKWSGCAWLTQSQARP